MGVLRDFTANKTYLGVPGEGSYVNGHRIQPKWTTRTADACLMTGFPAAADKEGPAMAAFLRESARYKKIRMIGSAALAIAYVAEGTADTYQECATNLWDVAAGLALIKGSGGHYRMTSTGKRPLNFDVWVSAREEWTR
jgi:myo-inositol-1(or 4)-monophosphatase